MHQFKKKFCSKMGMWLCNWQWLSTKHACMCNSQVLGLAYWLVFLFFHWPLLSVSLVGYFLDCFFFLLTHTDAMVDIWAVFHWSKKRCGMWEIYSLTLEPLRMTILVQSILPISCCNPIPATLLWWLFSEAVCCSSSASWEITSLHSMHKIQCSHMWTDLL